MLHCHKFAELNGIKHAQFLMDSVHIESKAVSHRTHATASQYAEYSPALHGLYLPILPDKLPTETPEYDDETEYWH